MRSCVCAPSRVICRRPFSSVSKGTCMSMSFLMSDGPSVTSTRTASSLHRPAPLKSVSFKWFSGSSAGSVTAAMPPCAYMELLSSRPPLLMRAQDRPGSRLSAAYSAAMPQPTMTTSYSSVSSASISPVKRYLLIETSPCVMLRHAGPISPLKNRPDVCAGASSFVRL